MNRDRMIQLIAVLVMVVATTASGTILPRIIRMSDEHALRYTDVSVEGAPAFVALGPRVARAPPVRTQDMCSIECH